MFRHILGIMFIMLGLSSFAALAQNLPNATEAQKAALTSINAGLAGAVKNLTDARRALIAVAVVSPRNDSAIRQRVEAVAAAELALANARADAFAKLQSSPEKLNPAQIKALTNSWSRLPFLGSDKLTGTIPNVREAQVTAVTKINGDQLPLTRTLADARVAVAEAVLTQPRNDGTIQARIAAVQKADLAVATARADAFQKLQASKNRFDDKQVAALLDMGGSFTTLRFTEPAPIDPSDHEGYVSLFDGVSLKDWEGNPNIWRVENGAIVGESTPQKPSGNSYLWYRPIQAKDFTLKLEIKIEGTGGSGIQYRSKVGLPWLTADNVPANLLPINNNWMMTGPQADFWPSTDYTGQYYSENTPMRIQAWRGQVVEGAGLRTKRLMGNIGDRAALNQVIKKEDWNEYTIIARGGTLMHILNGQLMAVMVDDDPESSNNQSGLIGIEIEQIGKIMVRNIWLKRIN